MRKACGYAMSTEQTIFLPFIKEYHVLVAPK